MYKWCVVPACTNTSIKTPEKIFVSVPKKPKIRQKWLVLARRNPGAIVNESTVFFCEDHFDLPNDMENYMEYHLMGSVSQIRMKQGCVPSKFECQADRRKRTSNATERPYVLKKQRKALIEEFEKDLEERTRETSSGNSVGTHPTTSKKTGTAQEIVEDSSDKVSDETHPSTSKKTKAAHEDIGDVNEDSSDTVSVPEIEDEWVSRPDVCRCCLDTAGGLDLTETYTCDESDVVFLDILRECYGVTMTHVGSDASRRLCEGCATHLLVARDFKRRVMRCEERFTAFHGNDQSSHWMEEDPLIKEEDGYMEDELDMSLVKNEELDIEEMVIKEEFDAEEQNSVHYTNPEVVTQHMYINIPTTSNEITTLNTESTDLTDKLVTAKDAIESPSIKRPEQKNTIQTATNIAKKSPSTDNVDENVLKKSSTTDSIDEEDDKKNPSALYIYNQFAKSTESVYPVSLVSTLLPNNKSKSLLQVNRIVKTVPAMQVSTAEGKEFVAVKRKDSVAKAEPSCKVTVTSGPPKTCHILPTMQSLKIAKCVPGQKVPLKSLTVRTPSNEGVSKSPKKKASILTRSVKVAATSKEQDTKISGSKPRKRGSTWDEDSLKRAMDAVHKNQLSTNAAALKFNIPRRTLRNHLPTGDTTKITGKTTVLTKQLEEDLVQKIKGFAKLGVPLTSKFIRNQAFLFCERLKIKHSFNMSTRMAGCKWLRMFLIRNPSIKKPQIMNLINE